MIFRRLRNPPPAESESWEKKFDWSLFGGVEPFSIRYMTEFCPTNDPTLVRMMAKTLSGNQVAVQKHAVKCLSICGEKYAEKSWLWEFVLQELKAIRETTYDTDEDRTSRAHAIGTIEKRIQGS